MSKLNWDVKTLPTLGLVFIRTVRDKMHAGSSVRFGTTGAGIKPHYQIKHANGNVIAFNGLSHSRFDGPDVFNDANLSEPFDYSEITAAYNSTKTGGLTLPNRTSASR